MFTLKAFLNAVRSTSEIRPTLILKRKCDETDIVAATLEVRTVIIGMPVLVENLSTQSPPPFVYNDAWSGRRVCQVAIISAARRLQGKKKDLHSKYFQCNKQALNISQMSAGLKNNRDGCVRVCVWVCVPEIILHGITIHTLERLTVI